MGHGIRLDGLEKVIGVTALELLEHLNEHSVCRVSCKVMDSFGDGDVSAEYKNRVLQILHHEQVIYTGYIHKLEYGYANDTNEIAVTLYSGSLLLDLEEKSRSFQDLRLSYHDVIESVLKEYEDAASITDEQLRDAALPYPVIQYQETDWQFIKRLASHFHLPLVVHSLVDGGYFYSGLPGSGPVEEQPLSYRAGVRKRGLGGTYRAEPYSRIKSLKSYQLGSEIVVNNQHFIIEEKRCKIEKEEVEYSYHLVVRAGCQVEKRYNRKLTGTSLLGNVLHTDREVLRLHLDIDSAQNAATAYEYQWTPVSGNVLYLMPQVGTKVSLYFGDWCESSGKAINCVRMNGGAEAAAMPNHEERELLTEHGKKLELSPAHVKFENSPSDTKQNSLGIADAKGITFETSGSIAMTATEGILIEGLREVNIHGEEGVFNYHGDVTIEEPAETEAESAMAVAAEVTAAEQAAAEQQKAITDAMEAEADQREKLADGMEAQWKDGDTWQYSEAKYLAAAEREYAGELRKSASTFILEDTPKETSINLIACFTLEHSAVTYISRNYGGHVSFITSKTDPCLERFEDYTAKYYFDWWKFAGRVTVGVIVVAGGVAIIVASGGTALPAAAGVVGQALVAGGATVLIISASDLSRGVLTDGDELFTAVARAVIVALITAGLSQGIGAANAVVNQSMNGFARYLIVGAVAFTGGVASSAAVDYINGEEFSWERALKSGIFDLAMAWLAMGLKDATKTATAAEGTGQTGYDYLDDQLGSLKDKVEVKGYHSSESVNEWWASKGYDNPPYTEKTVVQEIKLKEDTIFVRVYDGENSGLYGGWVMKVEDIKGLTPAQIQDKFALPTTPKYIAEVKLNAGDTLRMGEANPIFGFDGGGTQFDLMGQYMGEFNEIGNLTDWSIGQ